MTEHEEIVSEMSDNILNGNWSDVYTKLETLPSLLAAWVVLEVVSVSPDSYVGLKSGLERRI